MVKLDFLPNYSDPLPNEMPFWILIVVVIAISAILIISAILALMHKHVRTMGLIAFQEIIDK